MIEKNSYFFDAVFVCVGGGSNVIGLFHAFLGDPEVELYGVEAGGTSDDLGKNAATLASGKPGILQGTYSMLLHDDDGLIQETHSVSAGLDYPGVGPEHAFLQSIDRVKYTSAKDNEALQLLREVCELEGILPAIESSHAFVEAKKWAQKNQGKTILIGLSGRGDKDMPTLSKLMHD
jgi:tryptophan synthase beta chain